MMRRHDLDPISLTFGFAFTALGLLFLLGQADQAIRLRWIWPLLLLALGVGILLDLARSRDRERPDTDPEPTPEDAPHPEAALDAPEDDAARADSPRPVDSREHPT
jgi:hypothetical protein